MVELRDNFSADLMSWLYKGGRSDLVLGLFVGSVAVLIPPIRHRYCKRWIHFTERRKLDPINEKSWRRIQGEINHNTNDSTYCGELICIWNDKYVINGD